MARVAQADAALAPSFQLGGSLGLAALTLGSLTSGSAVVGSLLAGVSMPLFDGGAAARPGARPGGRARSGRRGLRGRGADGAEGRRGRAGRAARRPRAARARWQRAADAAGNAALLARQRYGSGLIDFQTVLDTQRTQLNTQDSVAGATADAERRPCAPVQGAGRRLAPRRQRRDRPPPPKTQSPAHDHSRRLSRSRSAARPGHRDRPREPARRARGARLVPPPRAVDRRAAARAGRRRPVVLASAPGRQRRAELHHADRWRAAT